MTDIDDTLKNPSGTTATGRSGTVAAVGADGDRQCGRCRLFFTDETTQGRPERNAWWVCPQCREILLPRSVAITPPETRT